MKITCLKSPVRCCIPCPQQQRCRSPCSACVWSHQSAQAALDQWGSGNFCPRFPGRCFLLPSNPSWEKRTIQCDNIVHMICDFTMLCCSSTILGTIWRTKNCRKKRDMVHKKSRKKHDIVHEKRQTRARFGVRINKQNMSWVSWVLHEEMPSKKHFSVSNGAINYSLSL